MVTRKKLAWAELKVGLLVVIGIGLLAVFILRASWGSKLFSLTPKQFYARTFLPSVERLKSGSPVWLSGLEAGYVTDVRLVPYGAYPKNETILTEISTLNAMIEQSDRTRPDYLKYVADLNDKIRDRKLALRTVEVTMKIDNLYRDRISSDSEVIIGSTGLIGESYIDISIGSTAKPPRKEFDPRIKHEVVVIEGLRTTGIREILTGANDVMANFAVLSDQMKKVANSIDPDRIGQTITTVGTNLDRTFKELDTALNRANKMILDVQSGRGTIGQLMVNPSVYDQADTTIRNVADITDRVRDGKGSLAKLLNDDSIYNSTDSVLKRADAITERIEKGEGTIGLLSKDRALYDRSTQTIEKMADILERADRGEGTIGKALRDEAMYNNLNQTLSEVSKLIYDFRQNPKKYLTINFKIF